MDKKQLDNMTGSSIMQRVDEINQIYKKMDPLYQIRNSSRTSEMMEQNVSISSVSNIGEIARKAFQESRLDFTSFKNQSAIAMAADLGVQNTITPQDTFLEMTKGMSTYNNVMSARERMIQSMGGTNFYEDMMGSVNLARKSIEPFIDYFNAAHNVIKINEISTLVSYFQSQNALTNSVLSDYASIFKQVESLRNLESFQSIFRLNDFQFEEVISTNLTQEDVTNFSEKPISEIKSDLRNENKLGKDFNLYVDEDKKYLSYIYHSYLLPFMFLIMGILIAPHIQQAQAELEALTTQQEVKAFTRSPPYTFDRQALKGHRFTTVSLLNLRDKPSMHSNVIESLPIGTIARVVNKSDRSWLLVEVEINGELEQGWILRRYTTYFK